MDILVRVVEVYGNKHWNIDPHPDFIEATKLRVAWRGLTRQDLAQMLGSDSSVSEVLSRKRPLTPAMIQRLYENGTFRLHPSFAR